MRASPTHTHTKKRLDFISNAELLLLNDPPIKTEPLRNERAKRSRDVQRPPLPFPPPTPPCSLSLSLSVIPLPAHCRSILPHLASLAPVPPSLRESLSLVIGEKKKNLRNAIILFLFVRRCQSFFFFLSRHLFFITGPPSESTPR